MSPSPIRFKSIPYLTRAERQAILDECVRTDEGCLLYRPNDVPGERTVTVRGERHKVARVMWAETYAHGVAATEALDTHEVIHIAECPHTGDDTGHSKDYCVEPTHLKLGDRVEQAAASKERRTCRT